MPANMTGALDDLEARLTAGQELTASDAARIAACPDLVSVGMLGERERKVLRGDRVTFGRVTEVDGPWPTELGEAGEVRLTGRPASIDEARARVREAAGRVGGVPLTGFSLADLVALAGGDHLALADLARALRLDGLEAVAETPLDALGDGDNAVEVLRAVAHGGLAAWRATVNQADSTGRFALIALAADLQRETGAFRAFAPLPRVDAAEAPATGYDDVRTIALARVWCRSIPSIQVDWTLHGPKLAQVAIAFGADDLDAVAAVDVLQLGHRRSPAEDVRRQIRAAFAQPAERNGRYELRA